ncbi:hypothetical protein D9M72_619710 [compost metagenome]
MDIASFGFPARFGQRRVQASIEVLMVAEQVNHGLAEETVRRPLDGALGRRMNVARKNHDIEVEIRHRLEGGELKVKIGEDQYFHRDASSKRARSSAQASSSKPVNEPHTTR